jgi:predicted dehydrogenase
MERIRIGLIGCGGNMRGHIRRLLMVPEAEIVGIVEPARENVARAVEQYPALAEAPAFSDHREMLQRLGPAAVTISTPHTLHAGQILDSLDAGAHVLVEKPMTCTSEEARTVCERAARTGKTVMVSYQRHQQALYRWMRAFILGGGLGEIQFVTAQQYQSWYEGRRGGKGWRHLSHLSGGGQLNDSGSHLVDILLHITGLVPQTVSAWQQNLGLEVDVNMAINVQCEGGALASIAIVGQAPGIGGAVYEDVTLTGSEAGLYYRVMGQPERRPLLQLRRRGETEPEAELPGAMPPTVDPDRAFIDVLLGRAENEAPPECGLRTIQLSEAAWRSASAGGAPTPVETA